MSLPKDLRTIKAHVLLTIFFVGEATRNTRTRTFRFSVFTVQVFTRTVIKSAIKFMWYITYSFVALVTIEFNLLVVSYSFDIVHVLIFADDADQ